MARSNDRCSCKAPPKPERLPSTRAFGFWQSRQVKDCNQGIWDRAAIRDQVSEVYLRALARTSSSIRPAAVTRSSCSQTRTTVQPASRNRLSVSQSLATFASILARHHAALFLGLVPWTGHPCQKQPSTKTATRGVGKLMSIVLREPSSTRVWMRKRKPRAWSMDRKASSC